MEFTGNLEAAIKEPEEITLLVVEDDPAMLVAFQDVLEGAGFNVITAQNGQIALEKLEAIKPDLILSDISMPVMDGYQLFEAVRESPGGAVIPFIFLTARGTREDVFAGKSLGADDYITKPVTTRELLSAVKARIQRSDELMLAQLKAAYKDSLFVLANAIERRDSYTHAHMRRLNAYARALAEKLEWDHEQLEDLEFGAILHDIGKIYIPEAVLQKEGKLSEIEMADMRKHPEVGAHMIKDIPYLASATPMVLHHHERWDGDGYPEGLAGEKIPMGARVLAVADAFDAMTSNRPYRDALPAEVAYQEILNCSGTQFDPQVVEAMKVCWETGQIKEILKNSNGHNKN
ncbi:MAG: response regulator [Anaerolineales bacterium]|jgi:putative two-component system response regulator